MNECDFGVDFATELSELGNSLSPEEIKYIQNKCREFLKTLIFELIKRMPTHLNILSKIKNISPKVILNPLRPKFTELPLDFVPKEKWGDMEIEYRKLLTINWNEVWVTIPEDTIKFWRKVVTIKNAAGELMFENISRFAFVLLSLPSSNASVERSFSLMNVIKSKLRNRMMLKLLNSIMLVRGCFNSNGVCCKTFQPTKDMLDRFNSKMYSENSDANSEENKDTDAEVEDVINLCNAMF